MAQENGLAWTIGLKENMKQYYKFWLFLFFIILFLNYAVCASARGPVHAASELNLQAPVGWKFGIRGKLRDRTIKKYIPKHEDMFHWSRMIEITHFFKVDVKDEDFDIDAWFKRDLDKIKSACEGFSMKYDPTSLVSPGVVAEYVCPKNAVFYKGELGIIAMFVGANGVYKVHWYWRGPYFDVTQTKDNEGSKYGLPVSKDEREKWYKYFSKIKLEKKKSK